MADKIEINLLENGEFTKREIASTNVGELRNELEIPANANVMVGGSVRLNDYEISSGEIVAYGSNNKVGG